MIRENLSTFAHLRKLTAFGERPIGSEGNNRAAEYIRAELERRGWQVEMQPHACPYWENLRAELALDGQPLPVSANIYSTDCDLSAELKACGTLAELQAADLDGKILLVHGALSTQSIVPEYVVYAQGPDALAGLIREKNPAAMIVIEANPQNLFRFVEDWTFPIPSAWVDAKTGRALLEREGASATLRLENRRVETSTANVAGRRGAGEKRVVVCAHFDTAYGTPGAFDNASGTAVLLALAERLAGRELKRGVELVAFSGEDSGGTDFHGYEALHTDFENILAAVNVDGVGDWLSSTTITTLGGTPEFEQRAREEAAKHPDLQWVDPWYESDHSMFFFRGVPAVALSSKGYLQPVVHRAGDTDEWISPQKLERVTDLVEKLVVSLSEL